MSYAFNPALRVSSRPETPLDNQAQSTTGVHRRRFEVVDDDVMPLDYLIGVMLIKDKYSFVQYEPTESHKRSAGTKNAPVNQINMFVETLRAPRSLRVPQFKTLGVFTACVVGCTT